MTTIHPEQPYQLCLIRVGGSDATVIVELWDAAYKTLNISSGSAASSRTLTIGSTAKTLSGFLGDYTGKLPADAVGGCLRVTAGSIAINLAGVAGGSFGGTITSTIATDLAPTSAGPQILETADMLYFGSYNS